MEALREGGAASWELTAERRRQGRLDGVGWLCEGLDAADRSTAWLAGPPSLPSIQPSHRGLVWDPSREPAAFLQRPGSPLAGLFASHGNVCEILLQLTTDAHI